MLVADACFYSACWQSMCIFVCNRGRIGYVGTSFAYQASFECAKECVHNCQRVPLPSVVCSRFHYNDKKLLLILHLFQKVLLVLRVLQLPVVVVVVVLLLNKWQLLVWRLHLVQHKLPLVLPGRAQRR